MSRVYVGWSERVLVRVSRVDMWHNHDITTCLKLPTDVRFIISLGKIRDYGSAVAPKRQVSVKYSKFSSNHGVRRTSTYYMWHCIVTIYLLSKLTIKSVIKKCDIEYNKRDAWIKTRMTVIKPGSCRLRALITVPTSSFHTPHVLLCLKQYLLNSFIYYS